jgi:hypothetical protein
LATVSAFTVVALFARSRLACAALRFASAVPAAPSRRSGSTFARIWFFFTVSPTLTLISVTVPEVSNVALAVEALCTEPVADTVALTSPWLAATRRCCPVVAAAAGSLATPLVGPETAAEHQEPEHAIDYEYRSLPHTHAGDRGPIRLGADLRISLTELT